MSFSWRRVRAILVKELRDYRRNRFVVGTMTVLPLLFVILPLIQVFDAYAHIDSTNLNLHVGLSMLYMLVIPTFLPATLSAYSVVGEREQGTQEPILITPIRREEFLIGKALAAFVPPLIISYAIFGIFLAAAALFAHPAIASAIYAGTHVLVQVLFIPLLAGWGIWIGIAVSARSTDVRVAQQLSVLGTLPLLAILALISLNVITVSSGLAIGLASCLLTIDLLAWRAVGSDVRPRTAHHRKSHSTSAPALDPFIHREQGGHNVTHGHIGTRDRPRGGASSQVVSNHSRRQSSRID